MRAAHSFDMTAITKAATIVETSLPDQIANVVHVGGRSIPTVLIIASGADVMVGAKDVTAARKAFVDAGVDLIARVPSARHRTFGTCWRRLDSP